MTKRRLLGYHATGLSSGRLPAALTTAALMTAVLAGCSINRTLDPETYIVKPGDTLSEIGRRYHINWHDLARWNHIRAPYRLGVGQKITLDPYPPLNYADMSGDGPNPAASSGRGRESGATRALPQRRAPSVSRAPSGRKADQKPTEENAIDAASTSRAAKQTAVKAGGPSADGWQWPATGSVLRAYDPATRRHGIEIAGKMGGPVYAASSGTVVYNGTGLKGYGKLVIIKHGPHYLSAYGFNQKSRVKQGQTVAAGAHIADIGHGPGNKPMLHFEIRRDGEPIDPQKVLPKR